MARTDRKLRGLLKLVIGLIGLSITSVEAQTIDRATLEARCFDVELKTSENQLACTRLQAVLLKQLLDKKVQVTVKAPAVNVAAPNVQVPPAQVTVNVPDKKKAIYIRRNFVNCNKKRSVATCEYAARRLCRAIGYEKHFVLYDEANYTQANGLVCYDGLFQK